MTRINHRSSAPPGIQHDLENSYPLQFSVPLHTIKGGGHFFLTKKNYGKDKERDFFHGNENTNVDRGLYT